MLIKGIAQQRSIEVSKKDLHNMRHSKVTEPTDLEVL